MKKIIMTVMFLGGIILLTGCSKTSSINSNNIISSDGVPGGVSDDISPSNEQAPLDDSQLPPTPPTES